MRPIGIRGCSVFEAQTGQIMNEQCKGGVLILGGSGFLGTSLAETLGALGRDTVRTSREANRGRLQKFDSAVSGSLVSLLESSHINAIVNLVGNTSDLNSRGLSQDDRHALFDRFSEAIPYLEGKIRVLHIGSIAEYGSAETPIRENSEPVRPNAYGAGKLEETEFFSGLSDSGIQVQTLRPSIVFGLGQRGGMLVPSVIEGIRQGREVRLVNPEVARDFMYVKDFSQCVARALEIDWNSGDVMNIGSGCTVKVGTFVSELASVIGHGEEFSDTQFSPTPMDEQVSQELDLTLSRDTLSWSAKFDYKTAIADMSDMLRTGPS